MDIPNSSNTPTSSNSSSWDLDMTMGNHLLLDQLQHQVTPYEFLNPNSLDNNNQFQAMNHREMVLYEGNSINTSNNNQHTNSNNINIDMGLEDEEEGQLGAMKEMMYKIAAMQPVDIDPSTIKKPKRRNVRISDDPQSIAARHRRERISERIRILQRLVPGGTKMDTASMLDEAIRYVKFLKRQVQELQANPPPQSQAMVQVGALNWPNSSHGSGDPGPSSLAMGGHNGGLGFGFHPSDIRPN